VSKIIIAGPRKHGQSWQFHPGGVGTAMNVLILGDDPEARAWAAWFAARSEHHLEAVYPGFSGEDHGEAQVSRDLDDALATPGIELVVVGGPLPARGEALRRAAVEGLAIICLHPPGEDSEAYYQVALAHAETGAVIVPDLPLRLHPGVARLRQAVASGELGAFRVVRHESPVPPGHADLARLAFPRLVDAVRALLGEIEALTASGDPPGEHPDLELVVQLRAGEGRRAEVRTWAGHEGPARLTVTGAAGSLTLEYGSDLAMPARLIRQGGSSQSGEQILALGLWDPHEAIVQALSAPALGPTLIDGTRAMELSEAVMRSLRRGRTIDLHYESISEDSTFKSVMTSTGCMILLGALSVLPLALAGPALGIPWTIYLAYAIPPVLVLFVGSQLLRFGIRHRQDRGSNPGAARKGPRSWGDPHDPTEPADV
jgi:myo-inositol 2-dehydrogenase/D-chiro-inositol 1-dehydrogenase